MNEASIIDKLAEKVSLAVSQPTPLAGQVVEQFQTRAAIEACAALVLVLLAATAARWGSKHPEYESFAGVALIVGITAALLGGIWFVYSLENYLAPLPAILNRVR